MGEVTRLWYDNHPTCTSPTVDNAIAEEDDSENSDKDDSSVRTFSPPPRPATRSVSMKRTADEMEDSDIFLLSSPPRPKKVHRVGKPSIFQPDYDEWPAIDLITEPSSGPPLFMRSPSFELIELSEPTSISDDAALSALSSHLDEDYYQPENPWKDTIKYF